MLSWKGLCGKCPPSDAQANQAMLVSKTTLFGRLIISKMKSNIALCTETAQVMYAILKIMDVKETAHHW